MTISVGVLGGGSWGTTVAHLAAHNAPTLLWCRDSEVARGISEQHRNQRYLADYDLHHDLRATADLERVVAQADVLVMGVPSQAFREVLVQVVAHVRPWVPILSLTKGLESGTKLRMSQVIEEEAPGHSVGALTGPNLAKEILAGDAALSVIAMRDTNVAAQLQKVFSTPTFRVYLNDDIVGCEIGGALKNVVALASGMADGLGTGDNARAAIITRGLAELTRLGVAMGGRPATLAGLAGMGDLMATCISPQSRNRHFGEQLGKGQTVEEVAAEMNQVAEGVKSAPVVLELATEYDVRMPLAEQVARVVSGESTAAEAYQALLGRRRGFESDPAE
ncbi:MAG: NAD(P)H-dependent glycerol-3-phosphate dehydrogenase [Acidimicrobiales bacterium]